MSLERDRIGAVAQLARLAIDADETPAYQQDLGKILSLVERLQAVDTGGVEPLAHPLEAGARLRPDEVTEADCRQANQQSAPEIENGYYLVPRVIE
jgi:aspartyl-tRNA(Asn)/glutamyl-tRNA(Gln) amidotransferase subunit C